MYQQNASGTSEARIKILSSMFEDYFNHFLTWPNNSGQESLTDFFPGNTEFHQRWTSPGPCRRTDGLLSLASKAVSSSGLTPHPLPTWAQRAPQPPPLKDVSSGSPPTDSPSEGGAPSTLAAGGTSSAPLPFKSGNTSESSRTKCPASHLKALFGKRASNLINARLLVTGPWLANETIYEYSWLTLGWPNEDTNDQ